MDMLDQTLFLSVVNCILLVKVIYDTGLTRIDTEYTYKSVNRIEEYVINLLELPDESISIKSQLKNIEKKLDKIENNTTQEHTVVINGDEYKLNN